MKNCHNCFYMTKDEHFNICSKCGPIDCDEMSSECELWKDKELEAGLNDG